MAINTAAPILFDMDADGIKTGTGWIKADDALVVLDRNGNGLIDSGAELFGDSTVLQNGPRAGQKAANGFEALADLDANADGVINSADAAYANLRLWQDANQDGISQSTELKTLANLGIASIKVAGTASNVNLGGGNTQVLAGSLTSLPALATIPVGMSGHVAQNAWIAANAEPDRYLPGIECTSELAILGNADSTNKQVVAAVITLLQRAERIASTKI